MITKDEDTGEVIYPEQFTPESQRYMTELMTGENSYLKVYAPEDCDVLCITEKDDIAKRESIDKAKMLQIKGLDGESPQKKYKEALKKSDDRTKLFIESLHDIDKKIQAIDNNTRNEILKVNPVTFLHTVATSSRLLVFDRSCGALFRIGRSGPLLSLA